VVLVPEIRASDLRTEIWYRNSAKTVKSELLRAVMPCGPRDPNVSEEDLRSVALKVSRNVVLTPMHTALHSG
jgi:hypothetical protein